jgi:hypothetical protein
VIDYRHLWPGANPEAADWELSAVVSLEARTFSGIRCTSVEMCPGPADAGRRRDRFAVAQVEVTRAGGFLVAAGLSGHLNASNSYGESLVRGLVHARAVVLLPFELSLSGRGELVFTRYREQVPVARNLAGQPLVSIEDESRSTLRLELARPLGGHVDLGLRYTLYGDELATGPAHYRRQTALLFDRRDLLDSVPPLLAVAEEDVDADVLVDGAAGDAHVRILRVHVEDVAAQIERAARLEALHPGEGEREPPKPSPPRPVAYGKYASDWSSPRPRRWR